MEGFFSTIAIRQKEADVRGGDRCSLAQLGHQTVGVAASFTYLTQTGYRATKTCHGVETPPVSLPLKVIRQSVYQDASLDLSRLMRRDVPLSKRSSAEEQGLCLSGYMKDGGMDIEGKYIRFFNFGKIFFILSSRRINCGGQDAK